MIKIQDCLRIWDISMSFSASQVLYAMDPRPPFWERVLPKVKTILLLTNCEVHTAKYSDRSFEVRTE